MKRLIVDTANILFRVAAAHGKYNAQPSSPKEAAGLAMHMALQSLNRFFKQIRPDQMVLTFEGGNNWRKTYTRSAECKSKKVYKANRIKDDSMIPFFELIASFEELARNHTALACLSHPLVEGDDLIGGFVQRYGDTEDEIIVLSGDKDFVQLLKYKNVTLIDPDKGKPRSIEKVCGVDDAEFFMFEKCFRGDKNDNVFPALPRVFKKRLLKAYTDEYELTKLLNETWTYEDPDTGEKIENLVSELFIENDLLMNLESQPPEIRQVITDVLDTELNNAGKFSFFHFTRFCGKYELKQIADNAQQFADMFSASADNSSKKKGLVSF